jgi:hypothetical protein
MQHAMQLLHVTLKPCQVPLQLLHKRQNAGEAVGHCPGCYNAVAAAGRPRKRRICTA